MVSERRRRVMERITTRVMELHLDNNLFRLPQHLRALRALADAGLTYQGRSVYDALLQNLRSTDDYWRPSHAATVIGELGPTAARADAVAALVAILREPPPENWRVQMYAAQALGKLGSAAASCPEVPDVLYAALRQSDYTLVRTEAVEALSKLGTVVAGRAEIVQTIWELVLSRELLLPYKARWALRELKPSMIGPQVLSALLAHLSQFRDSHFPVKDPTATPTKIGASRSNPRTRFFDERELLRDLVDLAHLLLPPPDREQAFQALIEFVLAIDDDDLLWTCWHVIGRFGDDPGSPETLGMLLEAVWQTTDPARRTRASEMLGRMRGAANSPGLVAKLWDALRQPQDESLRWHAALLLFDFEQAESEPEIVAELITLVCRAESEALRARAVRALGRVGSGEVPHAAKDMLLGRLRSVDNDRWRLDLAVAWFHVSSEDGREAGLRGLALMLSPEKDPALRTSALRWLGELGAAAAEDAVVRRALVANLKAENNDSIRDCLVALGPRVIHPELMSEFVRILSTTHGDDNLKSLLRYCLPRFGSAAAHPEVISGVIRLVRGSTPNEVRCIAIETLGDLGPAVLNHPGTLECLLDSLEDRTFPDNPVYDAKEVLRKFSPFGFRFFPAPPPPKASTRLLETVLRMVVLGSPGIPASKPLPKPQALTVLELAEGKHPPTHTSPPSGR